MLSIPDNSDLPRQAYRICRRRRHEKNLLMEKKTTSWFVAVVTPNTEKRSAERLTQLVTQWKSAQVIAPTEPITTYVPSQKEVRIQPSTSRRVEVERLLCPCYLFIECSDQLRYKIASEASFIHRFLMDRASTTPSGRNDFARIPHPQMLNFIRMVGDGDSPITIDPTRLRAGSKVRIKTGRLRGIEAFLEESPNGTTSIALRVNFLGYAKMNCPIELLELIE